MILLSIKAHTRDTYKKQKKEYTTDYRFHQLIETLIRDSVEGQGFLLIAETDNKLIGYISAQKGRLNRIAHSAWESECQLSRF